MEMGMSESGLSNEKSRRLEAAERIEKEAVEQILKNVPQTQKYAVKLLIEENLAKGDRELPSLFLSWSNLLKKKTELYEEQMKAPNEKAKNIINGKLLEVWKKILQKADQIDKKIMSTALHEISESLRSNR